VKLGIAAAEFGQVTHADGGCTPMARLIGGWFRGFLGVAIAAAWALGGPASTAAPLQLVTDQFKTGQWLSSHTGRITISVYLIV